MRVMKLHGGRFVVYRMNGFDLVLLENGRLKTRGCRWRLSLKGPGIIISDK